MTRHICVGLLALAACASPSAPDTPDAAQAARADAAIDAAAPPPSRDAAPPPDACGTQVSQLLVNPAFDMSPRGTGWQQIEAVANSPLITDEDGVAEHTAPAKAWLGGFEAQLGVVEDALWQEVAIPAHTTQLVLSGVYDVRTSEAASTVAYDTAELVITDLDGVPIQRVLALSNKTVKTAWTSFAHAFTQDLSGRTVRILLTSSNDDLDPTSFYFDSFTLTAIHACAN